MRIEVTASGSAPGGEVMRAVEGSFRPVDLAQVTMEVGGMSFPFCDKVARAEARRKFIDLQRGDKVALEVPDQVRVSLAEVRMSLSDAMTAFDDWVGVVGNELRRD